ncbi:hypothetical protein ASPZODRAFT_142784 [Penicilliopsis zonata CBS 506.65]|uniref:DUF202 domain-containing protein n=1 Tax=Penicilliopsis zonata CBS 506.65 TaxID=1073090 RepID=A0A1L9SG41_9EURO|nr:hypothetical protein ASPZODRAFT_142784 [Penicilliopsis zonata CBS 506.65]OJJ46159.1 hypothetical protein ASPZODRAFT_142784 [Penicilliopsis zonata CBS 506.65]
MADTTLRQRSSLQIQETPSNAETESQTGYSCSTSSTSNSTSDGERDALELNEIPTQCDDDFDDDSASISSGEYRVTTRRTVSRQSTQTSRGNQNGWIPDRVRRFWTRHVVLTVPQKNNRDHFGKKNHSYSLYISLERTFLAYIRTSVTLAMQGVLIAQLFRLQQQTTTTGLGFYRVGIPLSVVCYVAAMAIALMGAHRFWKQQNAIALGKVYAGGWELNCIGGLMILVILTTLVLAIAIMAEIDLG